MKNSRTRAPNRGILLLGWIGIAALFPTADAFASSRYTLSSLGAISSQNRPQIESRMSVEESVEENEATAPGGGRKLSRPERKALERKKKTQKERSPKRKPKYTLHSTAVSKLTKESTADDVTRAIKRAQNNHDRHDLKVIADFLIDECDIGFAYGYRGSLLARLAVAALHFGKHEVAHRAIDIRRLGT